MQKLPDNIITVAPPRVIHVQITEEARQKAGGYGLCYTCILATQLQLMGYRDVWECETVTVIGGVPYTHRVWGEGESCSIESLGGASPAYRPEVVGESVVLTRIETPLCAVDENHQRAIDLGMIKFGGQP